MFQKLKRRLSNSIPPPAPPTSADDIQCHHHQGYGTMVPSIQIQPIPYEESEISEMISDNEIQLIRQTWTMLRNDLASFKFLGAEVLVRYFTKYPDYQRQFKSFKDIPILSYQDQQLRRQNGEMIRIDKKLMAHGTYVMYTIGMLVDNLEQPLLMEQMLKRLARNHYRRRINLRAFERLRDTLFEHLLDRMGKDTFSQPVQQAWRKAFAYLLGEIEKNFHTLESDIHRCGSYYRLNSLQRHAKHDLFQHYKMNVEHHKVNNNNNNHHPKTITNHARSLQQLQHCPSFNQRQKRNDYIELRMQDPKCKLRSFRMIDSESQLNDKENYHRIRTFEKQTKPQRRSESKCSSNDEDMDGIWMKTSSPTSNHPQQQQPEPKKNNERKMSIQDQIEKFETQIHNSQPQPIKPKPPSPAIVQQQHRQQLQSRPPREQPHPPPPYPPALPKRNQFQPIQPIENNTYEQLISLMDTTSNNNRKQQHLEKIKWILSDPDSDAKHRIDYQRQIRTSLADPIEHCVDVSSRFRRQQTLPPTRPEPTPPPPPLQPISHHYSPQTNRKHSEPPISSMTKFLSSKNRTLNRESNNNKTREPRDKSKSRNFIQRTLSSIGNRLSFRSK